MSTPKEIFVSIDVESNGPVPGLFSMLSIGAAAYKVTDNEFQCVGTFSANLEEAEGAGEDSDTMVNFWGENPAAWGRCREDQISPLEAMIGFREFLENLPGTPVVVAFPLGFDFTFLYYYLVRYTGSSPVGFTGIDAKSFAMAMRRTSFKDTKKSWFPARWFGKQGHTHVALDDAVEQGEMFCRMYLENMGGAIK